MAPAMHTEMWEHPATVANVATLRSRGSIVIDPASGRLTGVDVLHPAVVGLRVGGREWFLPNALRALNHRAYRLYWIGQLVSLIGSGLTAFALGIWVLQHTHSVTQYTLTIVFAGLPGILIGPIAGAYVDLPPG